MLELLSALRSIMMFLVLLRTINVSSSYVFVIWGTYCCTLVVLSFHYDLCSRWSHCGNRLVC